MSGKIVGASSGDSKVLKSPNDYLSEVISGSGNNGDGNGNGNGESSDADDDFDGINLFDYLVESTIRMDPLRNSSFTSVHSSTSKGNRKRSHQLRVKRYTESGEEVSHETTTDVLPEAAPPPTPPTRALSYEGTPSSSLYSSPSRTLQQGVSRSARAKRYQIIEKQPSTIESSGSEPESDNEEDVGQSYIFEDQESGDADDAMDDNSEYQDYRTMIDQALSTESDQQSKESDDENDSEQSSESRASESSIHDFPPKETMQNDHDNIIRTEPSRDRNLGVTVSVRVDDRPEEPEPEEEDFEASSRRARESIIKRQAAALAIAAAVTAQERQRKMETDDSGNDGTRTRRVQLNTPLSPDTSSNGGGSVPRSPEETEQIRLQRIQELEQRKRRLEALAQASSMRRASSSNTASELSDLRKKSSRYLERPRTVNIDVYTGEVIGEMPRISNLLREKRRTKELQDESSSDYSSTEYDLPVTKATSKRRLFFVIVISIGLILGLSLGLTRNNDRNSEVSGALDTPTIVDTPTQAPSDVPLLGVPTVETVSQPSIRPSLRPVATRTPSLFASTGPTHEPTISGSLRVPSEDTFPPLIDVDQELLDLLAAEWPILVEVINEETSPQMRALQWLSLDDSLSTYSTEKKIQRFALATFFYSTNGDTWLNNSQWLSDDDECTWFTSASDTQCDEDGLYTILALNFNNLNGTIPAELALLSNTLETIDLICVGDGPAISGTIPSHLGLLTRLQFLNIRGNQLEGSIASDIGNLTDLRRLILRQNNISGPFPSLIGRLAQLRFLELDENQIGGTLSSEIGNLSLLESLLLSGNQMIGDIPSEIGALNSLKVFSADRNTFTSIPTEIGNLSSLTSLTLWSNSLRGPIPSEVGSLSNLLRLELSNNTLSGTIPTTIGNMALLRDNLDLSVNQLSGPIPSELGRLLLLRQLLLHSNELTGEVPTSFRTLSLLNTLRLESNILSGSVPDSICAVFNNSYPVFVSDCDYELECPCCSHCCTQLGECECRYRDDDELQFRCTGFP